LTPLQGGMKDALKAMFLPIVGTVAIAVIFIVIIWSGNFEPKIVNEDGRQVSASKDIAGYAVLRPRADCDDSYFPVCGFDGLTYDNACLAVANGTTVAYRGVCQE
jgi:hypothetical protein